MKYEKNSGVYKKAMLAQVDGKFTIKITQKIKKQRTQKVMGADQGVAS
jgi:hypothetical protein